jgi:hypothetical protein
VTFVVGIKALLIIVTGMYLLSMLAMRIWLGKK